MLVGTIDAMAVRDVLITVVNVFVVLMVVRALLSWFTAPFLDPVSQALRKVTDPVVRPIQRIIPPVQIGGAQLDVSILVVLLAARFVVIPLLQGL
jgi:YggT family protein